MKKRGKTLDVCLATLQPISNIGLHTIAASWNAHIYLVRCATRSCFVDWMSLLRQCSIWHNWTMETSKPVVDMNFLIIFHHLHIMQLWVFSHLEQISNKKIGWWWSGENNYSPTFTKQRQHKVNSSRCPHKSMYASTI